MAASTSSLDLLMSLNNKHKKLWDDRCYLEAVRNFSRDGKNSVNVLDYLFEHYCGDIRSIRNYNKTVKQVSLIREIVTEIVKKDNSVLFKLFLDNVYVPNKVHIGKLVVDNNAINCLSVVLSETYEIDDEWYDIIKYSCANTEFLKKVFESWGGNRTDRRMKALLKGLPFTNFETYQYLFEHGICAGAPAKCCIKAISISENTDDNLKKLVYAKDKGYHFRTHVLKFASVRDVNCVKWLFEHYGKKRNIWSPKFVQLAGKAGRLNNIKFARENGCPWNSTAYYWNKNCIDYLVDLDIVEYLEKNGCPINYRVKDAKEDAKKRKEYLDLRKRPKKEIDEVKVTYRETGSVLKQINAYKNVKSKKAE
jgi:hypothetical protein